MNMPDKRIEWCRENIPGFKAMHDQAEKARLDTEENRKRMAEYMSAANLRKFHMVAQARREQ